MVDFLRIFENIAFSIFLRFLNSSIAHAKIVECTIFLIIKRTDQCKFCMYISSLKLNFYDNSKCLSKTEESYQNKTFEVYSS